MVNKIDYSKLNEIIVNSQEELDAIPDDFKGRIYIQCATKIYVKKSYYQRVEAWGNSSVVAWEMCKFATVCVVEKLKLTEMQELFICRNLYLNLWIFMELNTQKQKQFFIKRFKS